MKKYVCLSVVLSAFTPLYAFPQWTASAYIGKTWTQSADIEVTHRPDTDVMFHDVGFDDRSFDKPLYYGLRGGYMFTKSAGVEGEFIHIKEFAHLNDPVGATGLLPVLGNVTISLAPAVVVQQYNVSHGLNLLLANFVLRHEFTPRFAVAFRPGLGVAIPHPEIQAFGATLNEYQWHGAAMQFAGGAEFGITRHLFWLGEYKFTITKPRFELDSTTIENSFATHHLVTGLGFRF
jgi:opacity protein-like surface antigen